MQAMPGSEWFGRLVRTATLMNNLHPKAFSSADVWIFNIRQAKVKNESL